MQFRYVRPCPGAVGCMFAALLLTACGGGNSKGGSSPPATPAKAAAPQRLDVTARDFALQINGPSSLRPGPVTITARNTGKQAHGLVMAKLDDGIDAAAIVTALRTAPATVAQMLSYVGGTTSLPPRQPWRGTTSFEAGNYVMLDTGVNAHGRVNVTRAGEVRAFRVSGTPISAPTAKPDASVTLFDYHITIPRVIPGKGQLRVENTGNDVHQLVFLRIANTNEGRQVVESLKAQKGVATTFSPVEALAPTSSSTATTVHYRLPRGTYLAYCTQITGGSGGRTHASIGMVAAFAVH